MRRKPTSKTTLAPIKVEKPPKKGVGICIPTQYRPTHLQWAFAFKSLDGPINWHAMYNVIENKAVDVARNEGAEWALKNNCKYLFFLGDDTIVPSHALRRFIHIMENNPHINVLAGVYCSKIDPPSPLIFMGPGEGPYWDWKLGELLKVWGVGMDCTLIRTDVFERLAKPWFLTIKADGSIDNVHRAEAWTEDLYFCEGLAKSYGGKLKGGVYADTSIQCQHYDVGSGKMYSLPSDCLPSQRRYAVGDKKIIDLGCGSYEVVLKDGVPVRVDLRDDVSVDYRCDVRSLPFATESWDIVFSMGTLDRFPHAQVPEVLDEWLRILKPGGELKLIVADFEAIAKQVLAGTLDLNLIYGGQDQPYNHRRAGFTPSSLRKLLESKGLKVKKIWQESPHWIFSQSIKEKAVDVLGDWEGKGIDKETGKANNTDVAPKAKPSAKHGKRKRKGTLD